MTTLEADKLPAATKTLPDYLRIKNWINMLIRNTLKVYALTLGLAIVPLASYTALKQKWY